MVEQYLQNLRLELSPFDAGGRGHRHEVAPEEHALDIAGRKDRGGQRRGFRFLIRREVARAGLHHRLAGIEFESRRIGRGFGLDEHIGDVV